MEYILAIDTHVESVSVRYLSTIFLISTLDISLHLLYLIDIHPFNLPFLLCKCLQNLLNPLGDTVTLLLDFVYIFYLKETVLYL